MVVEKTHSYTSALDPRDRKVRDAILEKTKTLRTSLSLEYEEGIAEKFLNFVYKQWQKADRSNISRRCVPCTVYRDRQSASLRGICRACPDMSKSFLTVSSIRLK
ncbi:MAG: hypothetical protein ACOC44_08620 [Promethearchaeia archaeon]